MGTMRKSRLSEYKQDRLMEHFVSGSTARTASRLCGVNRKTAAYFFCRLREIIVHELEAESEALFGGKSPSAVVGSFQEMLIEVMKTAENTTVKQRYENLEPGVGRSFHIPLMIQIATGKYWKQATSEERVNLASAFKRMSISTLATLFDGYNGEVFRQLGEKDGPRNTRLVMTELVKSDKSTVSIAYLTRNFGDRWQIIDVIVDSGISELLVRKSEYNLVLKEKGIPGLIDLLNAKADQLISG